MHARLFSESPEPMFYFKWTEDQTTWVAEWILAHRKFYRDLEIPWSIKYYYIRRKMSIDELFGVLKKEDKPQECHVKPFLPRRYKKAVKRLSGDGELTEREGKKPTIKHSSDKSHEYCEGYSRRESVFESEAFRPSSPESPSPAVRVVKSANPAAQLQILKSHLKRSVDSDSDDHKESPPAKRIQKDNDANRVAPILTNKQLRPDNGKIRTRQT